MKYKRLQIRKDNLINKYICNLVNGKTCPNGIAYCNILGFDKKAKENFVL